MLVEVLLQLVIVVAGMLAIATVTIVGRQRLLRTREEYRDRLRRAAPVAVVLAGVLLFNSVARQLVPELSWIIGAELTWAIYDLEGGLVPWLQSIAAPPLTAYFSFVYIYGYVFLLVFPIVAYFALSDTRPLRELLAAYTLNYLFGLVCYVLVIAYGPRNLMPEVVSGLLYETYPQYQHLTRQVNRNTNVFPSLHTSLSVTVALLAARTRDSYPRWFTIAIALAVSIALSTMYLGIHWAIDVAGGIALAYACVALAARSVGRVSITDLWSDRSETA